MSELSSYKDNKISNVNNDTNNELKLEIENKHILKDVIDERTKMLNPLDSDNSGTTEE
jgi:hypoxanthine-guanine phosphoribosyltransferase